jgi:hypothetical protein
LKRNEAFTTPPGMRVCAGHGDDFMLEPDRFGPGATLPSATKKEEPPKVYLWNPGSQPVPIADGECWTLGKRHVQIGHAVFSWEKKAIVGDLAPLCDNPNCRSVSNGPVLDDGYLLLPHKQARGSDVPGLERRLRESFGGIGERSVAESGPLEWKTWVAPNENTTKPLAKEAEQSEEPATSCEILKAPVSVRTSPGPSWTKLQEFTAFAEGFPFEANTEDALPTGQYLRDHACTDETWAVLEASLLRAARKYKPPADGSEHDWETRPAFHQVREVVGQCEPERLCAMGLHMNSELVRSTDLHQTMQEEARKFAHHLLLSCDPSKSRDILLGDGVEPSLQVEWLVAGQGKPMRNAQNLEKALRATFEKEGSVRGQMAIGYIAQDTRPDIAQMLLRFRDSATAAMYVERQLPGAPPPPKDPDPRYEFDMSVGSSKVPRLRALFTKRCNAMPTKKSIIFGERPADYRCSRAKEPPSPPEYFHVSERAKKPETNTLESLTAQLSPEIRKQCDEAFGGQCPEIAIVAEPFASGTWAALFRIALTLAAAPRDKSPLAGLLVDTPLRKEHGKITGTFRAWGDGRVYETTITELVKVSLGWPDAAKAEGSTLAIRGFIGWLNAVAEARADSRRLAWVEGFPRGVVVVRPEDLCKLTGARVVRATVSPIQRERWH